MTIANGVVYLNTASGLFAFDASTGVQLWVFPQLQSFATSPAVANGVVFVASGGTAYAVNAATGGLIWSYSLGVPYDSTLSIANGVVYSAMYNGTLYALDAATGSQLWTYTLNSGSSINDSSLVVADGVIYIGSDSSLYAFHLPGTTP